MRKEHAQHGRDHGPNGMDPIPGLGGNPYYMPAVQQWTPNGLYHSHVSNLSGTLQQDNTVVNASYYSCGTSSTSTPFLVIPVFLGKADGTYGPTLDTGMTFLYWASYIVRKGPDCLSYDLKIASAVVGGTLLSVFDAGLTWVTIESVDLYNAASSWGSPYSSASTNFRDFYLYVTGAAGDTATTYSGTSSGALNGGPGLYYLTVWSTGKNASSSGYKFDIADFCVSPSPT